MNLSRIPSRLAPLTSGQRFAHAKKALVDKLGHSDFFPNQTRTVRATVDGVDSITIQPTGFGKSACFQTPAILFHRADPVALTIVVSPLIALMDDQFAALRIRGVGAIRVHSDLPSEKRDAAFRAIKEGKGSMLYVSPEQLATSRLYA